MKIEIELPETDIKTPIDKRTKDRKNLEARTKELQHYSKNEYGYFAGCNFRFIKSLYEFINQSN